MIKLFCDKCETEISDNVAYTTDSPLVITMTGGINPTEYTIKEVTVCRSCVNSDKALLWLSER